MKSSKFSVHLGLLLGMILLVWLTPNSRAQVMGGPPQTSLPTSADGGNLGSGKLNFQPDLFTGRFTYSVPIAVPPGRQNSQPKISVNYNSSVGNGWCGVGWQLELGKIERETRYGVPVPWVTNGYPSNYDDGKSFTINLGAVEGHLVKTSPAGQYPLEYRLGVDKSFLNFFYFNQATNAYWCVIDKSGAQYYFGESVSNRLDHPVSYHGFTTNVNFGTSTFRWALDRIVDANGNTTYISYANLNFQLYPLRLSYGANGNSPALAATNTIDFVLTNRSDPTVSFMSNFRIESDKLLSQIVVKAGGQKTRRYVLGYTNSPATMRSLLTSVTEYGSDDTSSLPPVTFAYQAEQFGFGPRQVWGGVNSQGETNIGWNSIMAVDGNGGKYVSLIDVDGDGLPDRVMRLTNAPYNGFIVQRNTGSNFTGNYFWGGLSPQGTSSNWGSISLFTNSITSVDFFDINGDGRPDYVSTNFSSSTNWMVQLNAGSDGVSGFLAAANWGTLATGYPDINGETDQSQGGGFTRVWQAENMLDMNGDGLADRLMGGEVQYNTGNGFGPGVSFYNYWLSPYYETTADGQVQGNARMIDMNGDGLPDEIIPGSDSNTHGQIWYMMQQNDGTGYESGSTNVGSYYGNLLTEAGWASGNTYLTEYSTSGLEMLNLIDINGDGLPDRVMTKLSAPFDRLKVQLNNGSGFGPLIDWTNVQSEAGTSSQGWDSVSDVNSGNTLVTLVDINGDGLPDRVMTKLTPPYTNFWVQLNLGPFPDLLCGVSNGLGGSVAVTYVPSTRYDNTDHTWTNDPWAEGAKSLLPFPVYTVSSIAVNDGFGNTATNTYTYKHGFFDPVAREFRGFNSVAVTDPYGARTVTYFHQSGGFNDVTNGEVADPGTFSKKGMPYRVETWGTNGLLYQIVLNKIQEYVLNTNGWYFPCATQTMVLNYEGLGTYRATASQFTYDTNTENLVAEADYGEVTNVIFNGQTFTDVGSDSVYKWITYTNIGNILNRPSDSRVTSDSAGANRLQESLTSYDGNGNPLVSQAWLNTAGSFILTVSNVYDQYGNLKSTTDAAGITTTTTYDSMYQQFPVSEATGTFTTTSTFDNRSGLPLTSTDIKGLVSSNSYDVFFRPTASYISTNAYALPTLWQTRTTYTLGGISNGISLNCVCSRVNDAVNAVNGFVTYAYADGLGRTLETRAETETNNVYRVANTVYDLRGNPRFQTLAYFSSGTNYTAPSGTLLGALTGYDSLGRAWQSTPAVQGSFTSGQLTGTTATGGDTGSPVAPATTAFVDGGNPWATVVTDAQGKTKKSYRDAYGRTIQVTDVTTNGNYNTRYVYDLVGDLTNVTDSANNPIALFYDSLGRKTGMADPDMGTWGYVYDNAGRLTQQTDARTNTLKFYYTDPMGRLTSKQIYNNVNALVGTVSYTYDTSDDPNYTVYPGQLYQVTDLEGHERSSYDVRGRVLKNARYLSVNSMEYVTQATYDDADRVQQLTYPGNAATLLYSYDLAGHLSQIRSLAGTGTQEIFYTPQGFNALDQMNGYTCGNGVATAYAYYAHSARLLSLTTAFHGTNYQNLSYNYDNVSDVTAITDGVYSGGASATQTGITYDDFYRVTAINSTARGLKNYAYSPIGNLLTNQDAGTGMYQYGVKPHAVTSANGVTYGYDACGNMITRGGQTLAYDAQNQLVQVATGTNDNVVFGYDDGGERLWRAGTNGYTVWIGGIYELNNGRVLCHVIAGGQLVATFEPICGGPWSKVFGEERWYAATGILRSLCAWPFQDGRGSVTVFAGSWAGILGIGLVGGRLRLKRHELRRALRISVLWKQAVTVLAISAFLASSTGTVEAATYSPVFYYYHTDHLGSSNVLTDRAGNVVQHYEYSTFGQQSYGNNTSAFPVSNRYTGQIADDETGLYYYGGRYYDPQLGRFIQPDPTVPEPTDSQSLNRYSYCNNNPLNNTDPSGFDDDGSGGGGISFPGDDGGFPPPNNNGDFPPVYQYSYAYYGPHYSLFVGIRYGLNSFTLMPDYAAFNTTYNPGDDFPPPDFDNAGFQNTPVNVASLWLNGLKTGLNVASIIPGPVGATAQFLSVGINLVQGNYGEVASGLALTAAAAVGLGIFKAYQLIKDAKAVEIEGELAVDTKKLADNSKLQYPRIKVSKGTRAEVWERSKAPDGKVYDPSGREIKPGEPWELGHNPRNKLADARQRAAEQKWDAETWKKYQRDPDIYRPERPSTNAGHKHEYDW